MAFNVSLSTMKTQVRDLADLPSTSYVSDAMLLRFINRSVFRLYGMLVQADESRYTTEGYISISDGARDYALPSDLLSIQGVAVDDSSRADGYRVLENAPWSDRLDAWIASSKWTARWMSRGGVLRIVPKPSWNGTVRVSYIPTSPQYAVDSDEIDFVYGWDDWVVLDVCVRLMIKQDLPATELERERELARRTVMSSLAKINRSGPMLVADPWTNTGTGRYGRPFPPRN